MAAALTLLTEISISVMGVGTCGRRRVREGWAGARPSLGPCFSLLQPPTSQPGSVPSLATAARQPSQTLGY